MTFHKISRGGPSPRSGSLRLRRSTGSRRPEFIEGRGTSTPRRSVRVMLLGVVMAVSVVAPATGQAPVAGVADPESLFTSPDPRLHANKQVVLHIVRDLLEANQWELADKYLTKEYIQHNPNVASGLDPVLKFFGSRAPTPIPDRRSWKTQVVAVTAERDLVVVAFAREYRDPRDPGKTYTTTWFDMWRIKDGKADEHWDPATIAVPGAAPAGR